MVLCLARAFSNELIGRDEGMHTADFVCVLTLRPSSTPSPLHPDTVRIIINEAVTIEQDFLTGKFFSMS